MSQISDADRVEGWLDNPRQIVGGGTVEAIDLKMLAEPFPADDIEWRVGQAGKKGDRVWAKVLAYVTNRAIQDRLDDVCGLENWQNRFEAGPNGGVLCGLSIRTESGWVTKWDGAENTDFEAVKGGLSSAMKRAAVHWGIGRYLYRLEVGWANINDGGANYQPKDKKDKYPAFKWDPPDLPAWAMPVGGATTTKHSPDPEPPEPKDKSESLEEFHEAWDAVIVEVEDGDVADTNRKLEHYFLWAKTAIDSEFDAQHDYSRPLDAAALDTLTAILKQDKDTVAAWLETDKVREAVGKPSVNDETCAVCGETLTSAEKASCTIAKLPGPYCTTHVPEGIKKAQEAKNGRG